MLIGATALTAARLPTIQSEARADSLPAAWLPLHLGQWQGTDEPVAADVQKALPTAHILSRQYQSPFGSADVTIVSGSDATALHDPHDCLAGEGWHFLKDGPLTVDVGSPAGPIQIRDVWMVKGSIQARMWVLVRRGLGHLQQHAARSPGTVPGAAHRGPRPPRRIRAAHRRLRARPAADHCGADGSRAASIGREPQLNADVERN